MWRWRRGCRPVSGRAEIGRGPSGSWPAIIARHAGSASSRGLAEGRPTHGLVGAPIDGPRRVAGVAGADALRSRRAPGRDPGFTYLASFVVLGLALTFLGPVLTTLRDQVGVSTATISVLFGAQSLGYLAGAVLGGRGYDLGFGHRLMAGSLVGAAVAFFVISVAGSLAVLIVFFVLLGLSGSIVDVGGNALLVWTRGAGVGPMINALHFMFALGALALPAAREPLVGVVGWAGPGRVGRGRRGAARGCGVAPPGRACAGRARGGGGPGTGAATPAARDQRVLRPLRRGGARLLRLGLRLRPGPGHRREQRRGLAHGDVLGLLRSRPAHRHPVGRRRAASPDAVQRVHPHGRCGGAARSSAAVVSSSGSARRCSASAWPRSSPR